MKPRHPIAVGIIAAFIGVWPLVVDAATIREARVGIVFSPEECDVTAHLVIDSSEPAWVDHRLMLGDDGSAPQFAVTGAVAGQADTVGRTARLPISLIATGRNEYEVRYRFTSAGARLDRCPLLIPSAPTDGVARAVAITVDLPDGSRRLPGEFPAFAWEDRRGRVTLGHLPSFVRVPFATADQSLTWRDTIDVRRFVDIASIFTIALGTIGWLAIRRRRA